MSLRVIKTGILDTIQDQGRIGYRHLGINPGGAMDKLSAQIANILVGNEAQECVIELHFPASDFFFEQAALIAVCGADFTANLNGEEIPCWQPVLVSKYSILQFYRLKAGARSYLAIQGGFDIPKWLGSGSTNLKVMTGGYKGKHLQKDDEVGIFSSDSFYTLLGKKEFRVFPWRADTNWGDSAGEKILLLPGNEWHRLSAESQQKFLQKPFMISSQSDRMGYKLNGEPLSLQTIEELISSAVCFGTVQLLPDGQLIILMADHQTTGGYPRVACVIAAHHSRLAQMKPGETIQFGFTDQQTAEDLSMKQRQHLLQLENACKFKLEERGVRCQV